ncbi:Amino-acid acetyltransferase, mitochondrial [Actinomortierella ambigua]|uniref:Amino-acid acetyltransferase, mitochondrial n=1 Tax=Actinomortierella ambigua TaxID=1343610 RepID=A0A9P6Q4A4_9FUNG|nr:Amino-acid acetyltransferase, mitochondrial [Actinomortierella ambigua]
MSVAAAAAAGSRQSAYVQAILGLPCIHSPTMSRSLLMSHSGRRPVVAGKRRGLFTATSASATVGGSASGAAASTASKHLYPTRCRIPSSSLAARGVRLSSSLTEVAARNEALQAAQDRQREQVNAREKKNRDLILKVMGTMPSPREARQFLNRFSLPLDEAPVASPAPISSLVSPSTTTTATFSPETATTPSFVDSLFWPSSHHLALIKVEGPFNHESLATIANTLVQLQQLGLMSIVMLDNRTWWQLDPAQEERLGGSRLASTDAATVRHRMMKDMAEFVEELEAAGGKARPINEGLFEADGRSNGNSSNSSSSSSCLEVKVADRMAPIQSCLKLGQIPVVIPMVTSTTCVHTPVQSNEAIVSLAKHMAETAKQAQVPPGFKVPMRLIVINTTGGIPLTRTRGIRGPTHSFVNLRGEYDAILDDLAHMEHLPKDAEESYRSDLDMIKASLDVLPPTCSALITSSPSLTLITNLITDKPLFSSTTRATDPKGMLATTVIRRGLDIATLRHNLNGLDLSRMTQLLEASFAKPLDGPAYYRRIQDRTESVILTGTDYEGAAIVTREGGEDKEAIGGGAEFGRPGRPLATVAYLDKFAVAPKSQGIGVADILWKQLQDNFPDLVWRSRTDNPVNKWYFDRADGTTRIPGTNWTVFWYGPKGRHLIKDYVQICRDIPASFFAPPAKK